jgi:hypothetical protein
LGVTKSPNFSTQGTILKPSECKSTAPLARVRR